MSTSNIGFAYDEELIRKKTPYQLVPTNLKGVYTTPSWPDNFHSRTASQSKLMKNSLTLCKPKVGPGSVFTNPKSGDIMNIATTSEKILTSTTVDTDTVTISSLVEQILTRSLQAYA